MMEKTNTNIMTKEEFIETYEPFNVMSTKKRFNKDLTGLIKDAQREAWDAKDEMKEIKTRKGTSHFRKKYYKIEDWWDKLNNEK